jgi:hypothetical protein
MKPGDFLLGVLDFFAIVLPGAMATWLAAQYVPASVVRGAIAFAAPEPSEWQVVTAFLLSSYTLGHFVFMAGSGLDRSYDRWRSRVKPKSHDVAYAAAARLQKKLNEELTGGELTTLKWARTYIQVKAPHARVEIDRLEADHKFFRSVVVIGTLFAAHFLLRQGAPVPALAAAGLAALSYRRYLTRRWQMTELIFATAAIVAAAGPTAAVPTAHADAT